MIIPVGRGDQELIVIEKDMKGKVRSGTLSPCGSCP